MPKIIFSVTDEQRRQIKASATEQELSMSEYIRRRSLNSNGSPEPEVAPEPEQPAAAPADAPTRFFCETCNTIAKLERCPTDPGHKVTPL